MSAPSQSPPRLARVERAARFIGFDPRRTVSVVRGLPSLVRDRRAFMALSVTETIPMGRLFPIFGEDAEVAGRAEGAYFHQDLYVAQRVFARNPRRHLDIGSRIDGFVAHVASFREIHVVDIRPLETDARNISFLQADVMQPDALPEKCADSISSLNVIEHFGLGRYGDPIDPAGHRRGFANLVRACEPGGVIYVAVPIGPLRVEFNGHRVFSVDYMLELAAAHGLANGEFAYVDDDGRLYTSVELDPAGVRANFGCVAGVGLFEFHHPQAITAAGSGSVADTK